MFIRKYRPIDRKGIERINFETGFLGKSMNKLISSPKLWSWGIKQYFDHEPESIFVLEENSQVVGYVLGFVEEIEYDKKRLIFRSILRNLRFLWSFALEDKIFWLDKLHESFVLFMKSVFRQGFKEPKRSGHLHINLLPSVRGQGVGIELLKRFLKHAKDKGARKIYANSYQLKENLENNFWIRNGFVEYSKIKTSFWKQQLPQKDIYLICYLKELN